MYKTISLLAFFAATLFTAQAWAQSSIQSLEVPSVGRVESYLAHIGIHDLYNSSGARLTRPWQIIRQDRANYHRFGLRDRLDMSDSYFSDEGNRALLEEMLRAGSVSPQAARDIVRGDALVLVEIYRGRFGTHEIHITVAP